MASAAITRSSYFPGTLTVAPASLTVIPADATRVYGDANPMLTGSIVGGRNGDGFAVKYSTLATPPSPVGRYDIKAILAQGPILGNYAVTYRTGTLAVSRATLTVTAADASQVYGAPVPAFTARFTGFKNGETLVTSGVTGRPSLTTLATADSAPGCYKISAASGTLGAATTPSPLAAAPSPCSP